MNKLLVMFVMLASVFVSGCGTMLTRQLSEEEAFKYDKKYLAEHEVWMQTQKDTGIVKWIQPDNKKEECKVYIGTSSDDDITLRPDFRVFWDGQCRTGYAYGIGRTFVKGFLTDIEAISMGSGKMEEPKIYYQKDKLKNYKLEGTLTYDNAYAVYTKIKDDPFGLDININYGKSSHKETRFLIFTSPLQDNIAYIKDYGTFAYRITDFRNNFNDNRSVQFELDKNKSANGYSFSILKNGQRFSGEVTDGVIKRNVELPQIFYDHVAKIHNEIMQEGQKALDAQDTALQVKQQYKQKVCSDNVKVDFIDNAEYKAICEEDKYMADIKIKLDKELERISAQKAQDRMVRAREAEAMAAQQQAAAAQQQANTAAWASFNQSMHNMNMNSQMQQLNNNLFMMNRSPQQINVDHTIRTSNSPMWTPVR